MANEVILVIILVVILVLMLGCGNRDNFFPLANRAGVSRRGYAPGIAENIHIVTPPDVEEIRNLSFGIGEGIYGSGRFTSPMF
jgi:hypothetical protein